MREHGLDRGKPMLTRLRVSGFKNLVDVDVRFGPFTCIAGVNGSGKSNLFDAIQFLSALADKPLLDAARSVRDERERTTDVRSLFHRAAGVQDETMCFEAEMIIPRTGIDDLGQPAKATSTFLRYSLDLAFRKGEDRGMPDSLGVVKEELSYIKNGEAHKHILFPHSAAHWRKSVVINNRTSASPYISTDATGAETIIKRHQDGGSRGKAVSRIAASLPRTVLSAASAAESPTALLARREMQSWRMLQLEPSSLRRPDEFTSPQRLAADGSHLAAALHHLARERENGPNGNGVGEAQVYAQISNKLSELIEDVQDVRVDRDEKRQLLTLEVQAREGTSHPARALSDGTLRFLALAVLELESDAHGLICLEEPENGIHPERIPAMLTLLKDIATDVEEPVGPENPLRQVIINTHSPAVVGEVEDDSLVVAELEEVVRDRRRFKGVSFSCLPGTWRAEADPPPSIASRGVLLAYLNPHGRPRLDTKRNRHRRQRVVDRTDIQPLLPFSTERR